MKNSDNFDLQNWKLCLPVDENGSVLGVAYEVLDLSGFEHSSYFYTADDGAMVFTAITDGALTKGTTCARSELREMDGGSLAAWTLEEGGTMTATLVVDEAPQTTEGEDGRIVVGQIHGSSEELARVYWDNGEVYVKSDSFDGLTSSARYDLVNDKGETPEISLGEKFSYEIDARGNTLTVTLYADNDTYVSVTTIDAAWQKDEFYFKAGAYLGNNETNSTGAGRVAFYGLDFSREAGLGKEGLTDSVSGSDGSDYSADTTGTTRADILAGGTQADVIYSYGGNDTVRGWSGNDFIVGAGGNDTLLGHDGDDEIHGGADDDRLYGATGNDILNGDDGNDLIAAGDGVDVIDGGIGDDWLKGEAGADNLDGDDGNDRLYGGDDNDFLRGGRGADWLDGGNGDDTVYGLTEDDTIVGGTGADRLLGGDGNDVVYGEEGDDRLYGDAGADKLVGGDGVDTIYGGDGNDLLYADVGADNLYGGTGADVFLFTSLDSSTLSTAGRDDIYQFSTSEGDALNLSPIDANTQLSGNQAFRFVGTAAFSKTAGELRFVNTSSETYIYGDVNGDGASDFSIHVDGLFTLQSGSFVL